MSKKSGYIFGILLTMILCSLLAWYFCCKDTSTRTKDQPVKETVPVVTTPKPTHNGFAISDSSGHFSLKSNDNFNFKGSSFVFLNPLSSDVSLKVKDLATYIVDQKSKNINITGYYKSDEKNNSAYANLGLARANSVKNYFTANGISSTLIDVSGVLKDDLVPSDDGVYFGPVSFDLGTLSDDDKVKEDEDLQAIAERIKANPLVLYFNTAQASIALTTEERQIIGDISHYLDKVEGSTVSITGYTDNTGGRATNVKLGLDRANFAKSYLGKNGIPETKITTASKGPDQPIATNATEEGRAKNRRCVITLN